MKPEIQGKRHNAKLVTKLNLKSSQKLVMLLTELHPQSQRDHSFIAPRFIIISSSTEKSSAAADSSTSGTSSSSKCSVILTIAIATDGVSFVKNGDGSAWASSYPTASLDPVCGCPVTFGGIYTPLTTSSICINAGNPSLTPPTQTGSGPLLTSAAPQVACTAIANIFGTAVTLWTNYVTDNGAALEAQESLKCPGLAGWSVTDVQAALTSLDGSMWFENQIYQFTLEISHPQELICVTIDIIAARGPTNTIE